MLLKSSSFGNFVLSTRAILSQKLVVGTGAQLKGILWQSVGLHTPFTDAEWLHSMVTRKQIPTFHSGVILKR